jgi:hypothetical protein
MDIALLMELVILIVMNSITQMLKLIHYALNGNRVFVRLVLSDLSSMSMASALKLAITAILGIN